jgi:hypothetical protein
VNPRLVDPADAAATIATHLTRSWAERICAETRGDDQSSFACSLRPGVTGSKSVERIGFGPWHDWRVAWKRVDLAGIADVLVESSEITVAGTSYTAPLRLHVQSLDAGLRTLDSLGASYRSADIERARRIAARMRVAGAALTPATLRAMCRLTDADADVMIAAVDWLREHSDLSEWTARQLPVPGMHTKWLGSHEGLLKTLADRDIAAETRPRLSVVHVTYVDPGYLSSGARRHDAWTTGDHHSIAYAPRIVLIVENRDCRLWFPALADTVVVEGGGKAAAPSLSRIDWITGAEHVLYWGDIDADGFAILHALRAELAPHGVRVDSILMDPTARARYAPLGVNRDRRGDLLQASTRRLSQLTSDEAEAYAGVATAGDVPYRRIEQERLPLADALTALQQLVGQ